MPHKTFLAFIWPSFFAMILFIAIPIISVGYQSLFIEHEKILIEAENCGPFGCVASVSVDANAMSALSKSQPAGRFNGLGTYGNASHLAYDEIGEIFATSENFGEIRNKIMNLPFYKAFIFTMSYTFIVTPLVIILGFIIAVVVNSIPKMLKGPVIFFSLLPMIVTPLVGSLVLFWMIDSRGIIGAGLQTLFSDPSLSLKASPMLTWVTLFVYGVWHSAPFAFVVFYAGLQTVPKDTLESAMVDGANRWERVRFVIVPYMTPLVTFIALMQLMDNFRVFEPIIGFSAAASATSLSYLIYNDLRAAESPLYGSAAATSMLTIVGVFILLLPVLRRNSREFNRKT
ncbi:MULTISPECIES: carbohydrate ABC transporter permease [Falsihalocynthiibacter]|uniref:carbohydrate ABC transporter permease n=1 Tax=Falsihalocynthiibacter TaxID=2854182 RepID=UPI003003561A